MTHSAREQYQQLNSGSCWYRWEPHIHAPGTVLNDQFRGADSWEGYLTALENTTPPIRAIGITDYYSTETYERVCKTKRQGRLAGCDLIFPNVEMRLGIGTVKGKWVNIHLLVSPEDPNHLTELKRFLTRLTFEAYGDTFPCNRDDLIRLGHWSDPHLTDPMIELQRGTEQFKVSLDQLKQVYRQSDWARGNILVAVAGSETDGTSGVRGTADATLRQEIEKFAHVIFAGGPAQRDFWLGRRSATPEELRQRYGGLKPCMHGSDAHEQRTVGSPDADRYSWIKGAVEFDALRQACIDPAGRAYVGSEPPLSVMPSQIISLVTIGDADWAATPEIPLNSGLIAIIGARGSGKTALAEAIAAGCDAISSAAWNADENITPSFLARARDLLGNASATLTWANGITTTRALDCRDANGPLSFPSARYLSQQFVEELCSSMGVSDGLIAEIERVIFEAHPQDERDGAIDFAELRDRQTLRFRLRRQREAEAISDVSERVGDELEKENSIATLAAQVAQKKSLIANHNSDLAKLVIKGTAAQVTRHAELSQAAQRLRAKIQAFGNQRRTFLAMQDEVRSMRATKAPEMLRQMQARHAGSGLNAEQWDQFLLTYRGDVDKSLGAYLAWADRQVADLNGLPPPSGDPNVPLIADGVDLGTLKLALILAEMTRLEALFSADKLVRDQYAALTSRIAQENAAFQSLEARLTDARGAAPRRKQLQTEREQAYGRVFQAIIDEQGALADLYAPLMARLATSSGTLRKLSFSVSRVANVEEWGGFAEENLLDRRKSGPFYGRGSLISVATNALRPAWERGSAADVQDAMTGFIAKYLRDLLAHAPYDPNQQAEFRSWSGQFAQWLFSTNHILVRYEIAYDGLDIRKLSPGTRGIVLLLLYLALDDADDRPLIIDQPEENLDPKSVFDELVPLFISAKAKRQIIMVTHNANLVINTDADQIIVAEAGPHPAGGLPTIRYVAGGLESRNIRKSVCDNLEGGEEAFRERARRLRVRLDR